MIIFRNDDVTANTNRKKLSEIYGAIHSIFPSAEIWSCITIFCGSNTLGSVYPNPPFKSNPTNWFYKNADSVMYEYRHPLYKVASHGLYHIDHSKSPRETQEMSILGSCALLKTNRFVPPFNKYNQDTLDICFDNDIKIDVDGWLSLEHNDFNQYHNKWYFHSWVWSADKLKEKLGGNSIKLGLV